jgi:FixJ family two-component response regulator
MSVDTPTVFVVDDDRAVRDALKDAPGCLVLDVRLPGLSSNSAAAPFRAASYVPTRIRART